MFRIKSLNIIKKIGLSALYITSVNRPNRTLVRKVCFYKRQNFNQQQSSNTSRYFIYGGILAWLGFATEPKEKEDPLITTIKRGILSWRRNKFDEAEQIFHLTLKIAQERTDLQAQVYIYDQMANLAYEQNYLSKTEKLFKEVVRLLVGQGHKPTDRSIIEISLKLANLYGRHNMKDKAESGFAYCINTQTNKIESFKDNPDLVEDEKEEIMLWAMSVDLYARYCYMNNKIDLAEENFMMCLETSQKINGPNHPQTIILMNDLGSIAMMKDDLQSAHYYLETAVERAKKEELPELGSFYANLGMLYVKEKNKSLAKSNCNLAYKISLKEKDKALEEQALKCLNLVKNLPK